MNLLFNDGTARKPCWKADIIVQIYQDGALWLGPEQWPFPPSSSHQKSFEDQGLPPIGRLFVLPGSQPRLFDIREPALGFGPTTLIVFTLLQKMLENAASRHEEVLESGIRCGLTRVRRFHDRGYCRLDELTLVPSDLAKELYITYPREVWTPQESCHTDALLELNNSSEQGGGAYEVTCTFPKGFKFPASKGSPEVVEVALDKLQKRIRTARRLGSRRLSRRMRRACRARQIRRMRQKE